MGSVKIQWVRQGGAAVSRGTVAVFAREREDELCVPACTCIESGWLHAATACLLKQQNKHHLMNWAKYVALLIALDWCDDGLMKVGIMARCLDKEMRRSDLTDLSWGQGWKVKPPPFKQFVRSLWCSERLSCFYCLFILLICSLLNFKEYIFFHII